MELNKKEDEGADAIVENLKKSIATLEKENNNLKVGCLILYSLKKEKR